MGRGYISKSVKTSAYTVSEVAKEISILPDDPSIDDVAEIAAARDAYEKLSDEQKTLVDKSILDALENAEKSISALVTDEIKSLPENVEPDDEEAVSKARKAFDSLTDYQKTLIGAGMEEKLQSAEKKIAAWKTYSKERAGAQKASLSGWKVKAKRGRKALASWKANMSVSGYEIRYSTTRNFKKFKKKTIAFSSTKKLTVRKLKKGKTYYFKARAFTKIHDPATGKTEKSLRKVDKSH